MALDFPSTPTEGQIYLPSGPGGPSYVYYAPVWELVAGLVGVSSISARAYDNIVLNGSFDVAREYGIGTITGGRINGAAPWLLDEWYLNAVIATPGSSNFQGGNSVPAGTPPFGSAFPYVGAFQIVGAGNSFAGANDQVWLSHTIEGTRLAPLNFGYSNASPVTLSFWVLASAAGTFCVQLASQPNGGVYRAFSHNFTVNAANTWEYKTFTYPPPPLGATDWTMGSGPGGYLYFSFAAGSAEKTQTPESWQPWNTEATPQQSNFFATNGNVVQLAGVCLLPGSVAPTAEESQLMRRPFGEEQTLCQRHYMRYTMVIHDASSWKMHTHITSMRASPTISSTPAIGGLGIQWPGLDSWGAYASVQSSATMIFNARI